MRRAGMTLLGVLALHGCAAMAGFGVPGPSPFLPENERILTTDPLVESDSPAVAWNGEDFLVVWRARRVSGTDLLARRISPRGDFSDSAPWTLSAAAGEQSYPAIAWNGELFLVVWEDTRNGPTTSLYGARISANGKVLDPAGFRIARSSRPQTSPSVVWTGSAFYLLWLEDGGGSVGLDLYGTLVEPNAPVMREDVPPLWTALGEQSEAAVAWGREQGLVVWKDQLTDDREGADLYALRLSPEGGRLDPTPRALSKTQGGQRSPSVAWKDELYYVVWVDRREGHDELYGARVAANGHLHDPDGIRLTRGLAVIGAPSLVGVAGGLAASWPNLSGQSVIQGIFWPGGFGEVEAPPGESSVQPIQSDLPMSGFGGELAFMESTSLPQLRMAATTLNELILLWVAEQPGQSVRQVLYTTTSVEPSGL